MSAIEQKASDIHLEPFEEEYRIRFRIDGVLYKIAHESKEMACAITARLKVMAKLDIAERRLPQDGRFKVNFSTFNDIDFRLSTCPVLNGEKSVIRILQSAKKVIPLDELGFCDSQVKIFEKYISYPQGLILVTGPTGSGKTMTLYSALSKLNSSIRNIMAIEDPIEISLSGINQVQYNAKIGLTFANALRAFLRQDPDIIMLGEIRDLETADIAIKAAQTGHLVMATLHTNSACDTLTRLATIGISSYQVANSLLLIISQRLIRLLCQHCKREIAVDYPLKFGQEIDVTLATYFEAQGCSLCREGYLGRIAIYELFTPSAKIKRLMLENTNPFILTQQAKKEGMITLNRSAQDKLAKGLTTISELNRIIGSE